MSVALGYSAHLSVLTPNDVPALYVEDRDEKITTTVDTFAHLVNLDSLLRSLYEAATLVKCKSWITVDRPSSGSQSYM